MHSHDKSSNPFSDEVRTLATKIIDQSQHILQIEESLLQSNLVKRLTDFQQETGVNEDPFAQDQLDLPQELGLNVFFNTVNFCFKDPFTRNEYAYHSKNGAEIRRSTGLFTALAEANVDWNALDQVAHLTLEQWLAITQLSPNNTLYLGEERIDRITTFAQFLLTTGYVTISDFLEKTDYDAIKMLETLVESGCFTDQFLKRAQVTIHNVDNVLTRRKKQSVTNVETLSCMADYRIPQVFYNLGIVVLSDNLQDTLVKQDLIQPESSEELVLRASVIVIGMKLSEQMGLNESEVDGLLWRMSQVMAKNNELIIPHMIVPTDKY